MRRMPRQALQEDVLDVRFCGKSIHDVLEMTVEEAIEFSRKTDRMSLHGS